MCINVHRNICACTEICTCYNVVWCVTGHSDNTEQSAFKDVWLNYYNMLLGFWYWFLIKTKSPAQSLLILGKKNQTKPNKNQKTNNKKKPNTKPNTKAQSAVWSSIVLESKFLMVLQGDAELWTILLVFRNTQGKMLDLQVIPEKQVQWDCVAAYISMKLTCSMLLLFIWSLINKVPDSSASYFV